MPQLRQASMLLLGGNSQAIELSISLHCVPLTCLDVLNEEPIFWKESEKEIPKYFPHPRTMALVFRGA